MADKVDRDVELDPQVGDVVQVIPRLADQLPPAPITITAVTNDAVIWKRENGQRGRTALSYWKGVRVHGGPRVRLQLASANGEAQ